MSYEGLFDLGNSINSLALKYHHHTNDFKLSKLASLLSPNENVYCLLQPQPGPPNLPCAQRNSGALPSDTPNPTQCSSFHILAWPLLMWPESVQRPFPVRGIPCYGLCLHYCVPTTPWVRCSQLQHSTYHIVISLEYLSPLDCECLSDRVLAYSSLYL